MTTTVLHIEDHPAFAAILDRCALICKARREDLTARRRLPRNSSPAIARRIAIVATHKYFDNYAAVSRAFGRQIMTIWRLIDEAPEDDVIVAAEIVEELMRKASDGRQEAR